jgi:predicted transglutaminase-like cysteine proteinase
MYGHRAFVLPAANLQKWRSVQARHAAEAKTQEWRDLVAQTRTRSRERLLGRVNEAVNHIRYVSDPADRWQTPVEFQRGGGDCEDYAIAKYLLLREHGVPASAMRIVALYPAGGAAAHAVLVVDGANGPTVLDNLRASPYRLDRRTTARMAYAVNQTSWWVRLDAVASAAGR